ncbi:MAG: hypothetical protein LBJ67_14420, partial [Planctomycetaceae bacterium]|nr:hypothetical protein [Planctomycetaceae bacterium]
MKKMFVLLVASCLGFAPVHGQEQDYVDLDKITQISPDNQKKVTAALAAADAVKKAGAYIESLSDLLQDGTLSFPVGVKKGDYELIVHHIEYDSETHNPKIYATCAFKFKDSGEKVAFAGEAVFTGHSGVEMNGSLALIAPVRQNLGKGAAIIIKEGTKVNFDCDGVNNFDAKLTWMVTSGKIKPVNSQGEPTGKPLAVNFDAKFAGFDNYAVSLNINQSFTFQGLDDVIFTLKGAILDQSDTETSPMTRFPENYFTPVSEDVRQLWKGVAVTEASVSLPGVFKKPETNDERIILAMQDVLFDENGFSGYVSGKDVIPSENINRERWDISLSDLSIGFLKENLVSFGFGGHVNIPPLGKNALIPYRASFNPQLERYEIKAGIAGIYEFPVFKSTLALKDISTIEIAFKNGGVYPAIDASGKLSIDAPLGNDSVKTFSVPDIEFEHLIISRESPYVQIGNISVTGDFRSPKLGGFELSITDIQSFKNEKGSGLTFKTGVSLGDMFDGITSIQLLGDYEHWKFKEVFVDRVKVDYKSKAFSIAGDVWFKNSDPVYGNGFRGSVKLSVLEKFDFDAIGVFGEKDNYKYFLADVFYETAPTTGIFVPPVLSFYGFGGGLYRRMQQASKMPATSTANADNDFGKSLSGISYLPDSKIGLGFMATTKFSMQSSSSLFNAKVGLEMQFNSHGGLNFVQFRGDAGFMDNANKWGKLSDNIAKKLNDLEAKEGVINFQKADKEALMNQTPENLNSGLLTASLNIEYDLMNQVFSADLNTYLNAGLIKGIGQNNRLGGASAYFSPNKWYAYLGTPSDRLGIDILNLAKANAYFMLGDDMPALPPPPQKVLKNLSADKQAKLARTNTAKLNMGAGLAFGTGLEVNFDANLTPFYAHIGAGIGAEFLLSDLNGRTCVGFSGTPGFNGWFAQTQAWAYAEADIGIRVKIFGNRRSFSILDISASTLLEGSGPNPMYFAGAVGGRFSVLGGLVRGHCTFDFEIGEKCIIEKDSPFDEEVIAQLTPAEGAKDVNVFAAPQVLFNIPVDVRMTIDEENGTKGAYMVTLEECTAKYKDAGKIIAGQNKFSSDGLVYMLTPDEPFESQKEVEMIAKVSFKKLVNNKWEYVKGDDGKPVFESKTTAFHTGDRPKEILPEHVAYSYPINRQYNFYPKETNQGYLLLMQNYSYLFTTDKPAGFDQKLRI